MTEQIMCHPRWSQACHWSCERRGSGRRESSRVARVLPAVNRSRCTAPGVLPAHLDLTAAAFHAAPAPAPVLAAVVKQPPAPVGIFTELDAPRIARGQQFDRRASHGPEQEIEALLIRPPLPLE